MEIPQGRKVSKAHFFKRKYHTKMEFPEGVGGSSQKTFHGRHMDNFWNNTMQGFDLIMLMLLFY